MIDTLVFTPAGASYMATVALCDGINCNSYTVGVLVKFKHVLLQVFLRSFEEDECRQRSLEAAAN